MKNQNKIIDMFNKIAPTYDKANKAMSFGIDESWRKEACAAILAKFINNDLSITDVACGTGDMMRLWSDMSKGYNAKEFINWIVSDEAQKFIADFKLMGKPLFTPDAGKRIE